MSKQYHSRSYHRFFEDYTEKMEERNGSYRIVRVYSGDYYQEDCSRKAQYRRRLFTAVMYVLAAGCYVFGTTRRLEVNTVWYVAVCQGFTLIGMFWFLYPLFCYLTAKEKMTVREYRDASGILKTVSLAASACFGVTAAAILTAIVTGFGGAFRELTLMLPFLGGFAAMALVCLAEYKARYQKIPAEAAGMREGTRIKY